MTFKDLTSTANEELAKEANKAVVQTIMAKFKATGKMDYESLGHLFRKAFTQPDLIIDNCTIEPETLLSLGISGLSNLLKSKPEAAGLVSILGASPVPESLSNFIKGFVND